MRTLINNRGECNINDDLLIMILVRLPPKLIFRFRCVSKRWNNSVLDPYFLASYVSIRRKDKHQICGASIVGRLLGFAQTRVSYSNTSHYVTNVLQVTNDKSMQLPSRFDAIICFSGVLVLCRGRDSLNCYVVNLLNRSWIKLPRPINKIRDTGLVCEENKEKLISNFRVVEIVEKSSETMIIDTYCSRTGTWKTSKLFFTERLRVKSFWNRPPYVSNGVFHWCTRDWCLVVYDSNMAENYAQLIKLPRGINDSLKLTRSYGDDVLWISTSNNHKMRFWMLPKDENDGYKRKSVITGDEWILMHTFEKNSLGKDMKFHLEMIGITKMGVWNAAKIIKLEALIPSYPPVAVLNACKHLFLLNLETRLLELIPYRGCLLPPPLSDEKFTVSRWTTPLIEPLSLSTLASLGKTYN